MSLCGGNCIPTDKLRSVSRILHLTQEILGAVLFRRRPVYVGVVYLGYVEMAPNKIQQWNKRMATWDLSSPTSM